MAIKLSLAIFITVLASLHQTTVTQQLHVVGDRLGWVVPPGGPIAYSTWASLQTFTVGDILMFNFTTGQQDVARVTKEAYDACSTTNPIWLETNGPVNFTLNSSGLYYFIGTMDRHCFFGQKVTINVTGISSGPTANPVPPPPPPSNSVPAAPRTPMTYVVGDGLGWVVPPGGSIAYSGWAYHKTFYVGDNLVFNFVNGTQDVAVVTTQSEYDSCNTTNPTTTLTSSPAKFTLPTAGRWFFTSTYPQHCPLGQKLAINVTATTAPTPSSSSTSPTSSIAEPPHAVSPAAGGPNSPPSSSAPSTAVIGMFSVTLLSIVTSFLSFN